MSIEKNRASSYILTHPGTAHTDDFLACAVLSARFPGVPVFRREVTPAELQDPRIWVVDQGLAWDPGTGNFDHHQDTPGVSGACALTLVLEHLSGKSREELRNNLPWLLMMEQWDNNGPATCAREAGIPVETLFSVQISPLGPLLLQWFSEQEDVQTGDALAVTLQQIGKAVLAGLDAKAKAWSHFEESAVVLRIHGWKGIHLPESEREGCGDMKLLNQWVREAHPDTAFTITPNPRGGTSLFRRGDNPEITFEHLAGVPGVSFVHKQGFLAVAEDEKRALELLPSVLCGT